MLQKDRGLLEREGGHQYPLCTSPSVDVCPYNSLFLFGPPSVQPHLSFSFTHNYLSSPSIIRTSAQLRRSKSLKYRLRLIHSILSSSLKYLSPSFHTASQEVGVATNKSDQGPLGLMKKKKKKKTCGCFTSFSFSHLHKAKSVPPFLPPSGLCRLSSQSGLLFVGLGD